LHIIHRDLFSAPSNFTPFMHLVATTTSPVFGILDAVGFLFVRDSDIIFDSPLAARL
jgi:hypothetical protein